MSLLYVEIKLISGLSSVQSSSTKLHHFHIAPSSLSSIYALWFMSPGVLIILEKRRETIRTNKGSKCGQMVDGRGDVEVSPYIYDDGSREE